MSNFSSVNRTAWEITRRFVHSLPSLLIVITMVFMLIHLVPGDPVEQMLGESSRSSDVAALRHELGLDQPLLKQYWSYWKRLAKGDLGTSYRFNSPVAKIILSRYPATIELTIAALLVALLISIPAGIEAAVHQRRWQDRAIGFFSLLGLSFPNFALGPVLVLIFAIYAGWFPVSGYGTIGELILPALTLGAGLAAILTRMVRNAVLEQLSQDYVRTARAKGLREHAVLYKHTLRNGLIPVVTIVGLQFGALLAGTIVTETIFSWPGIGRLVLQAINSRDYPLVQGCVLVISATYIAVNLVTDLLYSVVDPRIWRG